MKRFSRLGIITGVTALAFAVLGLAVAVMEPASASDHITGNDDNSGLTISHLGI